MALAYILEASGYIAIACYEDGEYWTGAHKHDMTKVRVATDEEVAAFDAEQARKDHADMAYKTQFGITSFGRQGPMRQPKQYAAMRAADKRDPNAYDRFVKNFEG